MGMKVREPIEEITHDGEVIRGQPNIEDLVLGQSVQAFGLQMFAKLVEHKGKGGWEGESLGWLSLSLKDEWHEAQKAMSTFTASLGLHEDLVQLSLEASAAVSELADVANFCMMLSERIQSLYKDAAEARKD